MTEKSKSNCNYIVSYNDFKKDIQCETAEEVWEAIDKASFSGYQVWSPRGLNVTEFIPF